ncbi:PREDICTED: uncharacterized protein LOC107353321 [Acropora digitifera]|uniref:uncharacterized protein LOC107353321 n=1 Tax=Acropora digitifera TaxID=70779 RepID=UPI00077AA83C|nr:PREDICTED: uncharacterized protein LOC107353321 [Acropora digitifera]
MKNCLILLITFLSAHSVQGGLLFLHGSSVTSEGSTAIFICQETGEHLSTKLSWFFSNGSSDKVIADNGQLSLEMEKEKFKLLKAGTRLEITNITVNDGGNYGCIIRGENGEVLLNAFALLKVKENEPTENTLQEFLPLVPSIRPVLSDIIIPSPVGKTAEMMPRTTFYGAVLASLEGKNPTSVGDDVSPCKNTSNNTGFFSRIFENILFDEKGKKCLSKKEGKNGSIRTKLEWRGHNGPTLRPS